MGCCYSICSCNINTSINNTKVSVALDTEYPFRETLNFKVNTEKETEFTFWLQSVLGRGCFFGIRWKSLKVKNGDFHSIRQKWSGETLFTLHLPMKPHIESRPNGLYAITRGPLVYSLPMVNNG